MINQLVYGTEDLSWLFYPSALKGLEGYCRHHGVRLSVRLSVCLSVRLSVCPSVCLSVCPSGVSFYLVTAITCEGFEVDFSNWYQGCVPWRSRMSSIMDDLDLFFKVTEHFSDNFEDRPCDHDIFRRIWGRLSKLIPGMCPIKVSDEFDTGWPWPTFQGHRAVFR